MVVGLVYTEIDGSGDPKGDLATIKTCFVQEIPSVGPVQIDLNGHVETTFTNQAGGSFLKAITSEIQQLRAETKKFHQESRSQKDEIRDLHEESRFQKEEIRDLHKESRSQKEEIRDLREESTSQKEEIRDLQEEVTVLHPLRDSAIGIRKRWFGVFCKHRRRGGKANQAVIDRGNKIAHSGDITTDVYLLENGHMHYFHAFNVLYGVDWHLAKTLISMFILQVITFHWLVLY